MANSLWWWWETAVAGSAGAHSATQAGMNFNKGNYDGESWAELSAAIGNATHILSKTGGMDYLLGNVLVARKPLAKEVIDEVGAKGQELIESGMDAAQQLRSEIVADVHKDLLPEIQKSGQQIIGAIDGAVPQLQDLGELGFDQLRTLGNRVKILGKPLLSHYAGQDRPIPTHGLTENEIQKIRQMHSQAIYEKGGTWYPKYDTSNANPIQQKMYSKLTDKDKIPEFDIRNRGLADLQPRIEQSGATVVQGEGFEIRREVDGTEKLTWTRTIDDGTSRYTDEIQEFRNAKGDIEWRNMARQEFQQQGLIGGDPRQWNAWVEKDSYVVREHFDTTEKRVERRVLTEGSSTLTEEVNYARQGEVPSTTRTLTTADARYRVTRLERADGKVVTSFEVGPRDERVPMKQQLEEELRYDAPPSKVKYLQARADAARDAEILEQAGKEQAENLKRGNAERAEFEAQQQKEAREARQAEQKLLEQERLTKRQARLALEEDYRLNPKGKLSEVDPDRMKRGSDPAIWPLTLLEHSLLVLLLMTGLGDPDEGNQLVESRTSQTEAYNCLDMAMAIPSEWSGMSAQAYNDANKALQKIAAQIGAGDGLLSGKSLTTKLQEVIKSEASGALGMGLTASVDYTRMVLSIMLGVVMICQSIALKLYAVNPMWCYTFQLAVIPSIAVPAAKIYTSLNNLSHANAVTIASFTNELRMLKHQIDQIAPNA
jgi:hypothetical protein